MDKSEERGRGELVLVCGGRDYDDVECVFATLDELNQRVGIQEVITGGASGADSYGHHWANDRGIRSVIFTADWAKWGRGAGPLRNQRMLDDGKPTLVVAFPGGKGTADMCRRARDLGVPIYRVSSHRSPAVTSENYKAPERRLPKEPQDNTQGRG